MLIVSMKKIEYIEVYLTPWTGKVHLIFSTLCIVTLLLPICYHGNILSGNEFSLAELG